MDEKGTIKIVKILNCPIENNANEEITVDLTFDESVNSYRLIGTDIDELFKNRKISYNEKYSCNALFVVDDQGKKHTLFGCSFWCGIQQNTDVYVDFAFNSILYDEHMDNMNDILFNKVELKINYKRRLSFNFTINGINVVLNPVYTREGLTKETLEWIGEDFCGVYTNNIELTLSGNQKFEDYEKILWRLSEFALLRYEDMFFYDTFTLSYNGKQYKYKSFRRSNNSNLRKKKLVTSNSNINIFCSNPFDDSGKLFEKFVQFREDSGIIFDVFRSTVYSQSFREDYPLRLSQTIEGLANFLEIANTDNKRDSFNSAIQLSLYCNDYIKEQLPKQSDIKEFATNITKHRHKFSHVKGKGNYLQGEENEKYAEILYSTIRVLIIKHLKGEL